MTDGRIDAALVAGLQHEVLNPLTGALGVLAAMRDLPMFRPALAEAITAVEHELRRIERAMRAFADGDRLRYVPYVNGGMMLVPDPGSAARSEVVARKAER